MNLTNVYVPTFGKMSMGKAFYRLESYANELDIENKEMLLSLLDYINEEFDKDNQEEELNSKISDLESKIEDLESEVDWLNDEIDDLRSSSE